MGEEGFPVLQAAVALDGPAVEASRWILVEAELIGQVVAGLFQPGLVRYGAGQREGHPLTEPEGPLVWLVDHSSHLEEVHSLQVVVAFHQSLEGRQTGAAYSEMELLEVACQQSLADQKLEVAFLEKKLLAEACRRIHVEAAYDYCSGEEGQKTLAEALVDLVAEALDQQVLASAGPFHFGLVALLQAAVDQISTFAEPFH